MKLQTWRSLIKWSFQGDLQQIWHPEQVLPSLNNEKPGRSKKTTLKYTTPSGILDASLRAIGWWPPSAKCRKRSGKLAAFFHEMGLARNGRKRSFELLRPKLNYVWFLFLGRRWWCTELQYTGIIGIHRTAQCTSERRKKEKTGNNLHLWLFRWGHSGIRPH